MMNEFMEIEIKCYCDDDERVRRTLHQAGARFVEKRIEKDIYFNHPSRDFAKTDEALRLRSVSGHCKITYKGPKRSGLTKARVEHETVAGDIETMRNILLSLGFAESGIIEKERELFSFNGVEISIDNVKDLGIFVEIEKIGSLDDGIEQQLFDIASLLGLSEFERRSYLELKYYKS